MGKKGTKAATKSAKAAKGARGGKSARKAWRKADISDVEEALEDNRLVDKLKRESVKGKTGKNNLDELNLFTIDTAGSGEGISAATRRELAREKIFPAKGPKLGLSASEEYKLARAEAKLNAPKASGSKGPDVFDIWGAEPQALPKDSAAFPRVRTVALPVPQSAPKRVRVSAAPAVLLAHEGQSMNPVGLAYEEVTCLAAARQLEQEHEDEAIERRMKPITAELTDVLGEEALQGMTDQAKVDAYRTLFCKFATSDDGQNQGDVKDKGAQAFVAAVRVKRKSQAVRNREQKRKNMHAKELQLLAQKKLEKSVGELGSIVKALKQEDEAHRARRQYRAIMIAKRNELEAKHGTVPSCRRLGKTKFKEETIVVPEAEGLGKGLRSVPLKGCVIRDRIASIVRRGFLPPPPEGSASERHALKLKRRRLVKGRKPFSPLLRENVVKRPLIS